MGFNIGFDMVPPLSKNKDDEQKWQNFIEVIKEKFLDDKLVDIKANYIEFNVGEHPLLPFEGHKFLRFGSKVSGSLTQHERPYIVSVYQCAKTFFDSRVKSWDEGADDYSAYGWTEVHASIKSYDQEYESDVSEVTGSLSKLKLSTIPSNQLELLYTVETIPGRGKGIVARVNISKGTRIISEKPLFTTPSLESLDLLQTKVAAELRALSRDAQRNFFLLHNNFPGKYSISGIVRTNALPCGPGAGVGGIYTTICRINHSCVPNSHHSWNGNIACETIHATQLIKAGEEITISYNAGQPFVARQSALKDAFGFECACDLCSQHSVCGQASDDRRIQIARLDDAIGDQFRVMGKPEDCLADCHTLHRLLEEEYRTDACVLNARLYYDAFQICIAHGDQARAGLFAERAYKTRMMCEGDDSPATQRMKNFMANPNQHPSFGVSRRWRTSKRLVPKGLDGPAFEKWLWRERK
ncbi:hypothetical protein B0O99DRAFT_579827 [Bisporella sp. PMI_857]|nr:hypothetical protein B0O99DRAFT_579827 [Bisporella sp. PMI_857]